MPINNALRPEYPAFKATKDVITAFFAGNEASYLADDYVYHINRSNRVTDVTMVGDDYLVSRPKDGQHELVLDRSNHEGLEDLPLAYRPADGSVFLISGNGSYLYYTILDTLMESGYQKTMTEYMYERPGTPSRSNRGRRSISYAVQHFKKGG